MEFIQKNIEELTLLLMYLTAWEENGFIESENGGVKEATIKTCWKGYSFDVINKLTFENEEKGYFLPFEGKSFLRIVNNPQDGGEIYGAFYQNKMIAWIFLSVSNRMEQIRDLIPDISSNCKCADIDGVIVLTEYHGNGLQKILVKYLENKAKEKGITHIVAEVTFGNEHSLNNLQDLGYEIKSWYQKDEKINRHILLKAL